MYKKLGILGGMGPLATYTLYKGLIEATPAKTDQEHINMVIANAAYIPDRTAGILHGGRSPLPALQEELQRLEAAGCDLIAIPCNTSHYYYDTLQAGCGVQILNMVALTARHLQQAGVKTACLFATEGTIKTGVYQAALEKEGIHLETVKDAEIVQLMDVIYAVKAGQQPDTAPLQATAQAYAARGCEKIILGCTELSAIRRAFLPADFYTDALLVLQKAILQAFGKLV